MSPAAPPSYLPSVACPLATILAWRASCAAATFSFNPYHAFKVDDWSALPYEKDRAHGLGMAVILFISLRLRVASSSDCPPERNMIAGRAGGIDLERVLTVYHAISFGLDLAAVAPGVTMFGLRKHPSRKTL